MVLPDVNVLLTAHREDLPHHLEIRTWLEGVLGGESAYAMSELVLSGLLRVATHPRILERPSTLEEALSFVSDVRDRPNCLRVRPGSRHWSIFERLCRDAQTRGGLVADAWLAALAIESGCEWITLDRDFARFDGLRWRAPI